MTTDKPIEKNWFLIEKNWVVVSTIYTLISALGTGLSFGAGSDQLASMGICLFLFGVATIILQLVLFSYYIHDKTKSSHTAIKTSHGVIKSSHKVIKCSHKDIKIIKEGINRRDNLRFPSEIISLSQDIWEQITAQDVKRITILCYGTNGFGTIIPQLKEHKPSIKTDVLVCSPNSEYILYKDKDAEDIRNTITNNATDSIVFTPSPIPSTIRACVLYDSKDSPIWASIQPYYYNCDLATKERSFDYKNFFTIIAKKDSSSELLTEMATIITKEFERLRDFDLIKNGLNEYQIKAVHLIKEKGKISPAEYAKITGKNIAESTQNLEDMVTKKIIMKKSSNYTLFEE